MKVFGIGLARTGTTSLHLAFERLGLRSAPDSIALLPMLEGAPPVRDHLDAFDAFTDNPVPFLFRALHAEYPDARFVLTTRPVDEWLASMRWLYDVGVERLPPDLRSVGRDVHERVYGSARYEADALRRIHQRHHEEVRDHFGDSDQLLTVPLATLDWQPLCRHLDRPEPPDEFPRANAATAGRASLLRRIWRRTGR